MKRYINQQSNLNPPSSAPQVSPPFASASSFLDSSELDVEKLLNNSSEILRREITNLMIESSKGKLSAPSARDLVQYIKLLSELKKEMQEDLANLSDEELLKLTSRPTD